MTEFSLIDVAETPYLYVDRETGMAMAEIGEAMGSAFAEVWAFMQKHGVPPAGAALAVYYDYSPDRMAFRAGFTIARDDMAAAEAPVKADVTPAGRVAHGMHRGSYAGLQAAYGEMAAFVQAQGVDFAPPTWEVYLNSPDEVPEEQLLTGLYQALA
ncbi:GyrI-like domain-containing protein [Sinisalibacter aestuarii]|uniref:AraC effector-binding domain-containing protein n=1 Tax=Sinisalibacter aestuarii TaxID=2949426 RepID=A0ABQ5LSG6_9RHOB|nr:GyrI-like domain-containing protein [Sinisalibacter aestuarii]GKY87864.1 hypothetical protein STA1M1_17330 [Sinisalibacter aestuarii]